jgi:hypothetical protein
VGGGVAEANVVAVGALIDAHLKFGSWIVMHDKIGMNGGAVAKVAAPGRRGNRAP